MLDAYTHNIEFLKCSDLKAATERYGITKQINELQKQFQKCYRLHKALVMKVHHVGMPSMESRLLHFQYKVPTDQPLFLPPFRKMCVVMTNIGEYNPKHIIVLHELVSAINILQRPIFIKIPTIANLL